MAKVSFDENPAIQKRMLYFLVFQIGAMFLVLILIGLKLQSLALALSLLTFMAFVGVLVWLYWSYTKISIVQEKRNIQLKVNELQTGIHLHSRTIQLVHKKRKELEQAEIAEIQSTLETLQRIHIKNGLETTFVRDATIPGIGPKLKDKLAAYGIVNASHVSNRVSNIPGFGEAKLQSLMNWRSLVLARLESTKPAELPQEQSESIKNKFQASHNENNNAGQDAQGKKEKLETELKEVLPRLESLSSITFPAYLNKSLASQGLVSALLAIVLLCSQTISGFSATTSAILASIPTATPTSTLTLTPTNTFTPTASFTPTLTYTPTITNTPTITDTPTITFTPTNTFTPTFTFTPTRTKTPIPTRTHTRLPTWTPVPGGGGGGGSSNNCDPSYPTVCIQPKPPDLDCGDIPYRNFKVLPPDPHNFDGDKDGIGCES